MIPEIGLPSAFGEFPQLRPNHALMRATKSSCRRQYLFGVLLCDWAGPTLSKTRSFPGDVTYKRADQMPASAVLYVGCRSYETCRRFFKTKDGF
ncbi:hypothetical protein [Novosphingobium sp. Gsoil 351]|uniref:hypothetical protein n=1 Tax=Novosphingobium sp. Gsoil 351 TaxID=2675225 RepID=UPI001E30CCF4|nr:hypothetical protein [Novosphingobium sp. Gsoil 351]